MNTKYLEILNINFLHEYYADGKCRDLQVQADLKTQQWIKSNGMIIKQQNNSLLLIAPDTINLQTLISEEPEFTLQFDVVSNDPQFVSFTNIPLDFLGTVVYSNESTSTSRNGAIELSRKLEPDKQSFKINVGLEIDQLETDSEKWPMSYVVDFKSRSTTWKYFIIAQSSIHDTALQLSGQGAELFSGPTSTQIENGTDAMLFNSETNLIPLQEKSNIDLNLLIANGNTLFDHLPNASTNLVSSTTDGKQEIYSAIYVYL